MRHFLILLLICFSTSIFAAETGGDFWKNCPGTACPANVPDSKEFIMHKETNKTLEKMDAPELNKKETELKQEIKEIKEEKQRREATQ